MAITSEWRDELLEHYGDLDPGVIVSQETGLRVGELRELLQAHEELEVVKEPLNELLGVGDILDDALRVAQERANWRTDHLRALVSGVLERAHVALAKALIAAIDDSISAHEAASAALGEAGGKRK